MQKWLFECLITETLFSHFLFCFCCRMSKWNALVSWKFINNCNTWKSSVTISKKGSPKNASQKTDWNTIKMICRRVKKLPCFKENFCYNGAQINKLISFLNLRFVSYFHSRSSKKHILTASTYYCICLVSIITNALNQLCRTGVGLQKPKAATWFELKYNVLSKVGVPLDIPFQSTF